MKLVTTKTDLKTHAAAVATSPTPGSQSRLEMTFVAASVAAGTALLTVVSGSTTLFQATVTATSPVFASFHDPVAGEAGQPIVATLADAGASNVGSVTIGTIHS